MYFIMLYLILLLSCQENTQPHQRLPNEINILVSIDYMRIFYYQVSEIMYYFPENILT
jgi:hypothetical protein